MSSGSKVQAGGTGDTEPPPPPPPPPVGAYLKSITVQGFRGIGDRTTLELQPRPGLTIVSGRNGSGKSSFAEALEVALTHTSYRWKHRPSQWASAWRNLHTTVSPAVEVVLAEQAVGKTTVGVTWAGDDLTASNPTLQRHGQKREAGIESLGWAAPMESYRPLLSYEELGQILNRGPSKLYDALAQILGMEQVTDAINRLDSRCKALKEPKARLDGSKSQLSAALGTVDDERARQAQRLLTDRVVDVATLRALAAGTTAPDGTTERLQAITRVTLPAPTDVAAAADELMAAVEAMAAAGDAATSALERRIDLGARALDLHEHDGDQACPVCGDGTLDAAWASATREVLARERGQVAALKDARARLGAARTTARALARPLPAALADTPTVALAGAISATRDAWQRWENAPESDLELANHLRTTLMPASTSLSALLAAVATDLAERDEAWAAVASRLGAHADLAEAWNTAEPAAKIARAAHDWLKKHDVELKNERLAPIAAEAAEIWQELRQESNVDIDGLTLAGTATRRRVAINASVDGNETGALAVMSQGELHALSLALFLPRATMDASPFRFVVLDDPVQAMDPAKVDGLVATLSRIAEDRQVVVFSHDDRLASAVRRSPVDAQIWEVTRFAKSKVEIANAYDPSDRYLQDAFALVQDVGLPEVTLRRALPGLLRMAVESAAHDRYWSSRLAAGESHANVEAEWDGARLTRSRVSLAVYGEAHSLDGWLTKASYRRRALRVCTSGVHNGLSGDPLAACRDVEQMTVDVKAGRK
ncbi:AAA family ATPase [Mumia sp. zg.B21]|uniref:AAA family ATPase n=1 Tax=Mumia sp. zg.B21 TaxID=2855447 RepID=UPI00210813C9|nr:AAA family ATPase [Mumia sp. zg.B21]